MRTRRTFLASAAATFAGSRLLPLQPLCGQVFPGQTFPGQTFPGQIFPGQSAAPTRLHLEEIDRVRILTGAQAALTRRPDATRDLQSLAWMNFTLDVPALAAGTLVDPARAAEFSAAAAAQLHLWLLDPKTKPELDLTSYESLIPLSALAEVAVAIPFLQLEDGLMTQLRSSFAHLLTFLNEDRIALLARDAKNHHASSWLLQNAAYAHLTRNDQLLTECRHRFKTSTIRAQMNAEGIFPHELQSPDPYRDSLFNLDLLAGACVLLSTRFDSVWDHELQDGPGMRAVIARFALFIRNKSAWPYPADQTHFNLLPYRRPALLFAARAYSQPDYAALWRSLPADPTDPDILRTFPIRQPILWQTQPHAQI